MEKLFNQVNEQSWAEKYMAEAIILDSGDKLPGDIPTYNIRVYNGNPDARSSDLTTGTILKDVPVQVSREGIQGVALDKGDRVLVGFFNNDLNSPYIIFNQTVSGTISVQTGPDGETNKDYKSNTFNPSDWFGGSVIDGKGTPSDIISYAQGFIGKLTYSQIDRYGINNGRNTADCSSYVEHVFAKYGYQVGSNTSQQYEKGEVIGNGNCSDTSILESVQMGDIILVSKDNTFSGNGAHAGIIIGNDSVVHMGSSNNCNIDSLSGYFFSNTRWKKFAVRRHIKLKKDAVTLPSNKILQLSLEDWSKENLV